MNSLSVAYVSPTVRARAAQWGVMNGFAQLPEWEKREVLRRAVEWGVMHGVAQARARGLSGLGQDALIQSAVQKALAPMMPALGAELVKVVGPAAEKAANMIGPVIDEKIRKYGPWLAVITGTVSAILSILGMYLVGSYVVKKVG